MKREQLTIPRVVPAGVAFLAACVLAFVAWAGLPEERVPMRVPVVVTGGEGGEDAGSPLEKGKVTEMGDLAEELPGAWPGFRGESGDGVSQENVALVGSLPEGGLEELWAVDVGEGYAGAAVRAGRVYLMDYDREAQADALRCFSLADGKELWRFAYPLKVKRNHGMSRTVPVVTEKHVVAIGPKCHVSCLDALSGEFQWGVGLVREYGTEVPPWYAGQCPIVDGDRVILAPAGESLMVALDLATGEVIWKTPNPRAWKMTHVSIVPVELAGRKTYVYCGHRGVAGVAADTGEILWESTSWKISIATVSSPIPMPGDRLFFSGGYKAGSMMLEVKEDGGTWTAEEVFRLKAEVFGATQQTPVLYEGYLYGVRPNGELVCLDPEGKVLWTSGLDRRFGLGPFIVADGKVLVMDDHGKLGMAEAAPDAFRDLGAVAVLDGHDSWGPMAIAGGRLIARDLTRMVCVELKEK